jgi:hypothetical protein
MDWSIIHDEVGNFELLMLIQNIKRTPNKVKIIAGNSTCSFDGF